MRTSMDPRSLGESKTNYTNSNVRQSSQSDWPVADHGSSPRDKTNYEHSERDALGYRVSPKSSAKTTMHKGVSGGRIAVGVLAGAGVGMLAGILLAPEKGKDLRKQVANSASRLGGKVTKSFNSTKEKVSSWTGKSNQGKSQSGSASGMGQQSSSATGTMSGNSDLGPSGSSTIQRCL